MYVFCLRLPGTVYMYTVPTDTHLLHMFLCMFLYHAGAYRYYRLVHNTYVLFTFSGSTVTYTYMYTSVFLFLFLSTCTVPYTCTRRTMYGTCGTCLELPVTFLPLSAFHFHPSEKVTMSLVNCVHTHSQHPTTNRPFLGYCF